MMRISTFCVLSGALAALLLSATGPSAGSLTIPSSTPKVIVPAPKVIVHTPPTPQGNTSIYVYHSDMVIKGNNANTSEKGGSLKQLNNGATAVQAQGANAQDNVSLKFDKMKVQYQNQTPSGGGTKVKNGHRY